MNGTSQSVSDKEPYEGKENHGSPSATPGRNQWELFSVIPAQAGTQLIDAGLAFWIPACAGMTNLFCNPKSQLNARMTREICAGNKASKRQ